MTKILLIPLYISICFSQMNWEYEVVDTASAPNYFIFNSLSLDTNARPHILYSRKRHSIDTLIHAWRSSTGWGKEIISTSGIHYGYEMVFDRQNKGHIIFCQRQDTLSNTYIWYGCYDGASWQLTKIDSCAGYFGNYFWDLWSSIDVDSFDRPGLVYYAWNMVDSLHYIKYAYFNGVGWEKSIVEYDSAAIGWLKLTDFSPSLKFNRENIPYIAFYQVYATTSDTLKLAHYDTNILQWIVDTVRNEIRNYAPVSLELDHNDNPRIAHGGLSYTWWENGQWLTDDIAGLSLHSRVELALDCFERPHIFYYHWGIICPRYCYKDTAWILCGPVEPDSTPAWAGEADISIQIDNVNRSHILYRAFLDTSHTTFALKYAQGTNIQYTDEDQIQIATKSKILSIYPNPAKTKIQLRLSNVVQNPVALCYDVAGQEVFRHLENSSTNCIVIDISHMPAGVYFLEVITNNSQSKRKIVLLK